MTEKRKRLRGKQQEILNSLTPEGLDQLGRDLPAIARRALLRLAHLEARRYGRLYRIEPSALERYRATRKPLGKPPGRPKKPSAGRPKKKRLNPPQ